MNILTVTDHAEQAAELLRALSNPGRLTILCLLSGHERNVGELARATGLSQSALSQHLAILRRSGLVGTRRFRQNVFYTIKDPRAMRVIDTLAGLYCPSGVPTSRSADGHNPDEF
jgi:ArsR family transcriptional regulator